MQKQPIITEDLPPAPRGIQRNTLHKPRLFCSGLSRRRFILLLLALLSVCLYPVLFIYFFNIREAVFAQIYSPIAVFTAVGLAAWLIFTVLSGSMSAGALTALIFMLLFMNYSLLDAAVRSLIPDWRWWRIAPILLFLLINLSLFFRFLAKKPAVDANFARISVIVGAVFLALTIFNAGRGAYEWVSVPKFHPDSQAVADPSDGKEKNGAYSAGERHNFYYFIFDEYARQDVLKKYTGYDNTSFLKGLESRKFNVSYSSNAPSGSTRVSTGNALFYSLKYTMDAETMNGIKRPPLLRLFKQAGYKTYVLSPVYQFDDDLVDVSFRSTTELTNLNVGKMALAASFAAYMEKSGDEAIRKDRLNLLQRAIGIIKEESDHPKFIYFHIMSPHEPFVFDEDGGPVTYENMHNWGENKYYVGQLRFISQKIDELANTILKDDPYAVVLMQSDHGARYFPFMSEEEPRACLNVLYLYGQYANIEGLSTINTLRRALNGALGSTLNLTAD